MVKTATRSLSARQKAHLLGYQAAEDTLVAYLTKRGRCARYASAHDRTPIRCSRCGRCGSDRVRLPGGAAAGHAARGLHLGDPAAILATKHSPWLGVSTWTPDDQNGQAAYR